MNQSLCSITITLEVAFKFEICESGETNVRQVGILGCLYHCSGRHVTLRKCCTGNVTSVGKKKSGSPTVFKSRHPRLSVGWSV